MGEGNVDAAMVVHVRHADVTPGMGHDPVLNAAGRARAEELRRVLADADIGAIFITQYRRSRQTAEPLAADLGITPKVIDEVARIVEAIRTLPADSVALVVGHSDTVPEIIVRLGGPKIPEGIGEDEFDHLFVQAGRRLAHLRYGA